MKVWLYKIKLVKGGPWVPAKIWYGPPEDPHTGEPMDRSPRWNVKVYDYFLDDPFQVVHLIGDGDPSIIGKEIDEAEYQYLLAVKQWADVHDPGAPEANPRQKIDLNKMKPIKFG